VGLSADQREAWDRDGFFIEPGFADPDTAVALTDRIVEIAREIDGGQERDDLIVTPEEALKDADSPEGRVAKIFRVHRNEQLFAEISNDPRILNWVTDLIGPDVDCFLSQFIFKHPGALGQPWHQDQFYFRLEPSPQVGVWLACTAATLDNGPLWVVPGSHRESVHEDVIFDERAHASAFYVEIQGADTSRERVVLMEPGDLLVFHSHLRHRSTDNDSDDMRAAMVYHYADAESEGPRIFNHDWIPAVRGGEHAGSDHIG
jgi:phytanoyl-CoA hydroxylase